MGEGLFYHLLLCDDSTGLMTRYMHGWFTALLLTVLLIGCNAPDQDTDEAKVPDATAIIIDADTANEVDDLFALVGALAHTADDETYDLLAITSAQFHTSPLATTTTVLESQHINEDLIRLVGRPDIALPVGSNVPLLNDSVPAISPASTFIVEQAKALPAGEKLQLFILGSCTNAATAILQDPSIVPKIHIRYLGFWHDPVTNFFDKKEFNSGNDTFAVNVLLNTPDLEFTVMTATSSQELVFDRDTVQHQLMGTGPLGDYLLDRWASYDRWWTQEDPEKQRWIVWDVALIEAFFNPTEARLEQRPTPPENTDRMIGVYTAINAPKMEGGYWEKLRKVFTVR